MTVSLNRVSANPIELQMTDRAANDEDDDNSSDIADFLDTNPPKSRLALVIDKILLVACLVSVILVLITSFGLMLVHTEGVLHKVKLKCNETNPKRENIKFDNAVDDADYVQAVSGNFAQLSCNVSYEKWDPSTCVMWMRNNDSIPRIENVLHVGKKLQFNDVKSTDQGIYYCVVCSNKECTVAKGKFVNLKVESRYTSLNTYNFEGPVATTVRINKTAYFYCYTDINWPDNPRVTWYRLLKMNGTSEVIPSTDPSGTNQSLRIIDVQEEHAGWYTCQLSNSKNEAISKTAELKVDDGWEQLKKRLTIILLSLDGSGLSIIVIFIFKRWYDWLMLNSKQWTKKVFYVEYVDEDGTKVPKISIKFVPAKGQMIGNGYELPVDQTYEVPRENITLGKPLGEGNFGCVFVAQVKNLLAQKVTSIVAIKMLKDGHTDRDVIDLLAEMEVMKIVGKHDNIVNLLGTCGAGGELMVIIEFALNGSLKNFLEKKRYVDENGVTLQRSPYEMKTLNKILVNFAYQVACGMNYLASKKCVHRDLAARNVLIDLSFTLKICDFGLARDMKMQDYYRQKRDGAVPFRWLAPESLAEGKYDSQSDVWSYGVLLWEIFTLGSLPYPTVDGKEMLDVLKSGYRLEKPENCPPTVYTIMTDCWKIMQRDRPTFSTLVERCTNETMNIMQAVNEPALSASSDRDYPVTDTSLSYATLAAPTSAQEIRQECDDRYQLNLESVTTTQVALPDPETPNRQRFENQSQPNATNYPPAVPERRPVTDSLSVSYGNIHPSVPKQRRAKNEYTNQKNRTSPMNCLPLPPRGTGNGNLSQSNGHTFNNMSSTTSITEPHISACNPDNGQTQGRNIQHCFTNENYLLFGGIRQNRPGVAPKIPKSKIDLDYT